MKHEMPDAVDIDSTLVVGKPELGVFIDRSRAADLGVQVLDVAQALQYLVAGQKVSTYSEAWRAVRRARCAPPLNFATAKTTLQLLTVPSRKGGWSRWPTWCRYAGARARLDHSALPARAAGHLHRAMASRAQMKAPWARTVKRILEEEREKLPKGFSVKAQGQTKMMKETGHELRASGCSPRCCSCTSSSRRNSSHGCTRSPFCISLPLTLPFAILSVILFDQALDLYSASASSCCSGS
jgi:HAE1 family hydrophobic/amphiphilic exporter-1